MSTRYSRRYSYNIEEDRQIIGRLPTLRRGSRGDIVMELQRILGCIAPAQGGTPGLAIDGGYGPNTERAVRTFQGQTAYGLVVDGRVGEHTWAALSRNEACWTTFARAVEASPQITPAALPPRGNRVYVMSETPIIGRAPAERAPLVRQESVNLTGPNNGILGAIAAARSAAGETGAGGGIAAMGGMIPDIGSGPGASMGGVCGIGGYNEAPYLRELGLNS